MDFPGGSVGKESACNARDTRDVVSAPGPVRSPGEGHDNPLQYSYSCLETAMDRGGWWPKVHGVAKSWTRLKQQTSGEPVEPRQVKGESRTHRHGDL